MVARSCGRGARALGRGGVRRLNADDAPAVRPPRPPPLADAQARRGPVKGERFTAYAELLDSPSGKRVGHFTAAFFALDSPFADHGGSLELHTFTLDGGSINGLGTATAGADAEFAVIGGTGRYAGVHGTYLTRIDPRELGGAGAAEFTFTLKG